MSSDIAQSHYFQDLRILRTYFIIFTGFQNFTESLITLHGSYISLSQAKRLKLFFNQERVQALVTYL